MKHLLLTFLAFMSLASVRGQAFTENFDDITTLSGSGWYMQNNSDFVGTTNWFQGSTTVFPAYNGAGTSYIGANYNNVDLFGNISNWLLTPVRTFKNGDVLTFYTRTASGMFNDRLEVRLSTSGILTDVGTSETSVGVFSTLLTSVNPSLNLSYPVTWTQYTVTISGLATPVQGRVGFRYFVPDAGYFGDNSDYIGIDNVVYTPFCPGITIASPAGVVLQSVVGTAFSSTLSQTGGAGTVTYNVTAGALPAGITLSAAGVLSGTPTAAGNFSFTVTATDVTGCSSTQAFTFNIQSCIVNPVALPDITAQCSVEFGELTPPELIDSCGNTITPTTDETIFPVTDQGTTTITWTYTATGGTETITQNIVIDDTVVPAVGLIELPDITAECEVTLADVTAPTAIDDCAGVITGTTTTVFPVTVQGTTVITWTYDDGHGNTTTETQNIVIEDTTPPTLVLQDGLATMAEGGMVTIEAAWLDNGSFDDCGIASITASPNTFTCGDIGNQPVTVTVTDVNGNVATGAVQVVVEDPSGHCTAGLVKNNARQFMLYPNPASDMVTVQVPQDTMVTSVSVYSLLGQKLVYKEYSGTQDSYSVSLAGLQEGNYLIKIQSATGTTTQQIVKLK